MMVELNPIMRYFLLQSEWTFALVKAVTLLGAWGVLAWYARQNREFVRMACTWGSVGYVALWTMWFTAGHLILS